VKRAAEVEPVAMICEGTRVNSTQVDSEERVKEVAKERVEKTNGLVVVNFPVRDTDRMQSFFQVAQQTDRALVINLKQAYLLELFRESGLQHRELMMITSEFTFLENVGSVQRRPVLREDSAAGL